MAVDALWRENAVDHNAVQYRQLMDGLAGWRPHTLGGSATSGTANGGVLGAPSTATTGPLAVTERGAGANMSVDVAVGGALVWGTAGAGSAHRGAYFAYADATENVAITAADATNPRIDLVGIRIRDTAYGEADNVPVITVVTGTPAGVPAEPAVPDNFLTLARVDVPALDTAIQNAQITDRRRGMSALGGMAVVASSATYPTVGLWDGMAVYDLARQQIMVRAGSAWVRGPNFTSAGRTGFDLTDAGTVCNHAVLTSPQWDVELSDSDGFIAVPSATVTIPSGLGGIYGITLWGQYAATFGAGWNLALVSGGQYVSQSDGSFITGFLFQGVTHVVTLAATNTCIGYAYQISGIAQTWSGRLTGYRLLV